eukprot:4399105-Ditylum_brightwellii.AAC.1
MEESVKCVVLQTGKICLSANQGTGRAAYAFWSLPGLPWTYIKGGATMGATLARWLTPRCW